jgi:small GTP-binding protein
MNLEIYKFVIVGDSSVGKTSLLMRYVDGEFRETYISTIGIDFKTKTIEKNDKKYRIQIWDTAGQERFYHLNKTYYRGAKCIIIAFDLTNLRSFENIEKYFSTSNDEKKQNNKNEKENNNENEIFRVLIGTKADSSKICINKQKIDDFANKFHVKYFETSSVSGYGINELFDYIVDEI